MLRMTVLLLIAAATLSAQTPAWRITGLANGEYLISIDSAVSHGGRRSVRIEGLTATPMSTATVLQSIRVGQLRGKRVRLSAYIKTQDVSGTGAAVAVGAAAANSPGSQGMSMTPWVNGSTDWKLKAGHRIGVRVTDANTDWWLHVPTKQTVAVSGGSITLPFLAAPHSDTIAGDPGTQLASYLAESVTVPAATLQNSQAEFATP